MDIFNFSKKYLEDKNINYIIEISSVLCELNLIHQTILRHSKRLNELLDMYIWSSDNTQVDSSGNIKTVSKKDNQQIIYKSYLQKEIPSFVIYINLYIKSLSSLQNKVGQFVWKKEGLLLRERFYFKEVKEMLDKNKSLYINANTLVNFFENKVVLDLINKRNDIEHNCNNINEIIIFYLKNDHSSSDMTVSIEELCNILNNISASYNLINTEFISKLNDYISY